MNKSKYLITVVIPVFNARKYVEQFLAHISQQTFRDYEILFLDSYSTDGTTDMIKAIEETEDRIKLVIEKDKGIYDAMNRGIELAKGDWLYFMGCDDVFFDEDVLQVVSSHLTSEYDLVYGDVLWVPEEIMESGICTPVELINSNINHQRIFYRKELFQKYGAYDLQYKVASDHALNIRFFCNNEIRKNYIHVAIARYHSGGFSSKRIDEVFWNNWNETVLQYFSGLLPEKKIYSSLNSYYRYLIEKKKYVKAFGIASKVTAKTKSIGFAVLAVKQFFQSFGKHAS